MSAIDGPRLTASSGSARSLVVLVHGYGSNGADMIALAPMLRALLPDTAFVAPDAPQPCPGVRGGRQWWALTSVAQPALAAGARGAAAGLDAFVSAEAARLGIGAERVLLAGFSQGTMMALHVGLRRRVAGILGYSGLLADPPAEVREPAPVLLVHGDADPVVPVRGSIEAERVLRGLGVDVALHVSRGLGHSVDAEGLRAGAAFAGRVLR